MRDVPWLRGEEKDRADEEEEGRMGEVAWLRGWGGCNDITKNIP